jgi:hypothetical protein
MDIYGFFKRKFDSIKSKLNDPDELAGERRKLTGFSYSAGIAANLYGGNFYTGLLLLMNADDKFMGTLAMINIGVGILPVFSAVFLDKFEHRKKILIIFRILIYALSIAGIGVLALVKADNSFKLSAILMVTLISGCIANIASPGMSVWHIKLIPEDKRAGYFSFVTITSGSINYLLTVAASSILDHYKALGYEFRTLMILRAVSLIFAALDIFLLTKIKEYPNLKTGTRLNVFNLFTKAFKSKKYLVSVAIGCMYCFAVNIQGPYYTVYLLKELGLKYSYLSLVTLLYMPFMIFFMPVWSRIIRRTSWNRTLLYCMLIYIPAYFLFPFTGKETIFIFPLASIVAYIASPGIGLFFSNNSYHNLPEHDQTELLGFYATVNNLASLAGVALGRWFIGATEGKHMVMFGQDMTNKQYLMFLVAIGLMLMTATVFFIDKKNKKPA